MQKCIIKEVEYYGRTGYCAFSPIMHHKIGMIVFTEESNTSIQIFLSSEGKISTKNRRQKTPGTCRQPCFARRHIPDLCCPSSLH